MSNVNVDVLIPWDRSFHHYHELSLGKFSWILVFNEGYCNNFLSGGKTGTGGHLACGAPLCRSTKTQFHGTL